MSRVFETLPKRAPVMQREWYGIFAYDVPINELAWVIIPDFSYEYVWGPCKWQPRVAILKAGDVVVEGESEEDPDLYATVQAGVKVAKVILPRKDDECMVNFNNNREPWIPVWWPLKGMDDHGYPL